MKIAYVVAGTTLAATAGCQLASSPTSSAPQPTVTVTVPATAPANVYVPPTAASAAPVAGRETVRVPDMADRRLDVSEYMLSTVGLTEAVVGPRAAAGDPTDWFVCASQPRANTTVPSGTQVALIVQEFACT